MFQGNDRPGVMLSGAARRLIERYSVKPGDRAVVLTANASGDATVRSLESAGVQVARVVDARSGRTVVATHGSPKRVEAVELDDGCRVDADLLVTAVGWTAPTSLLNMAGDRPVYDENAARFLPGGRLPETVLATGGIVGDGSIEELIAHGRATGELAARRAAVIAATWRATTARARPPAEPIPEPPTDSRPALRPAAHPALFRSTTHGIVDYSEDVGSKDLVAAAEEGYDSVELVKRYTTSTMGPEQGKLETVNTVAVLAESRGETIGEVGTTVWRPPFAPITLGALGGRVFEPTRVSSIHSWHKANGMTPILAGQWIRPEHYGDPAAEVRNVRDQRRHHDVTPLGKLDLRGADVPRLLSLLYTNKWVQAAGWRRALRGDVRRGRRGHGRRGHRPPGRRPLSDDHHLVGSGHGVGMGRELAADHAPGVGRGDHAGHHGVHVDQRRRAPESGAGRAADRRRPVAGRERRTRSAT